MLCMNTNSWLVREGNDFYGAYDAQEFAIANKDLVGVVPVPSLNLVFTEEEVQSTSENNYICTFCMCVSITDYIFICRDMWRPNMPRRRTCPSRICQGPSSDKCWELVTAFLLGEYLYLSISLTIWLTHSLTHYLTHSLCHYLTHSLSHSLSHSVFYYLTHSLCHYLTHLLIYSIISSGWPQMEWIVWLLWLSL